MKTLILVLAFTCSLRASERRRQGLDGLVYIWIAPGSFQMGCSAGDTECFDWEQPSHPVTITHGFWIGQTEVTQQAWQRVMGTNPSRYRAPSLPVEQISWFDAQAYCRKIAMRLPTAAEWEYAARGSTAASRYGELNSIAWFDDNSGDSTHAVAGKQPNAFGLYDMLGNVWEWVQDDYRNKTKTLRGGSFFNRVAEIRVSNFLWAAPETAHRNMGVRCASN